MSYEVTIGIPIYNTERFIRRCMDSVLVQTYQSIEILVFDDGCTDSSIAIVEDYQKTHRRGSDIRIIRQTKNLGIGVARNRILEEARGKYLYYLDADDEILPNTIELLYNAAKRINAELIYGSHLRYEEWRKDGKIFSFKYPDRDFLFDDDFAHFVYEEYGIIQVPVWNILMQIDFLKMVKLHFPPVNFWEDLAATMFLPTLAKKVGLLSEITYIYHCRFGSLSNFQKRSNIHKQEIQSVINAMSGVKRKCLNLRGQFFFPQIYKKVMMTHFYIACSILRQNRIIVPAYTNREIREIMKSPLSLCEIISFRKAKWTIIVLYFIGILPSFLSVLFIKMLAYTRRLL